MNYNINEFYCTICGNKGIPIARKRNQNRKKGHLKKLWCLTCQKETNHAEINDKINYTYQDFCLEYNFN